VLHLSAHGSATGIELADEDGRPQPVDTDRLVAALRVGPYPPPLVVLSSCSGAGGDGSVGVEGLAAALIRRGADRVLAMQAPISDTLATNLAHHLYRALATNPDTTVSAVGCRVDGGQQVTDDLELLRGRQQAPVVVGGQRRGVRHRRMSRGSWNFGGGPVIIRLR